MSTSILLLGSDLRVLEGLTVGRIKEQVEERLDKVITAIREIQGPCMTGEKAADVLVVSIFYTELGLRKGVVC